MNNSKSNDMAAFFPVGAIVAFAGNVLETDGAWLECNGDAYSKTDYEKLYSVIGNLYGETDTEFNVPDYSGRFLRGASDTALVGTSEEYATGQPHKCFYATFSNIPSSTMNAGAGTGNDCAKEDGSQTIDTCTSGGDGDTRPINVYVKRFIRAR